MCTTTARLRPGRTFPTAPSATFVHYECTDPTSHWSADHLDPTCGVPGYDREVCACGYERNRTEIPATGDHVYDQEVVDEKYLVSAATCTAKAVYRYSCECGAEGEETFGYGKPNGHTHESVVTAPTCTEKGYTTYTCHCGDTYVADEVDKLGHDMGQWSVTLDPTCTVEGSKRADCSRCDYFETEAIPAVGHAHKAAVTAPTCTEKGYTTYTCHCGDTYVADKVDKLGHDMSQWGVINDPTCTVDGTKRRDCSRCDHFETEAIPAVGHAHEAAVTAPTCTEKGYTTYTCHCGDTYVADYVAAAHNFGAWNTAENKSSSHRTCLDCGSTETGSFTTIAGGICGESVNWSLTSNGTLWISGTGTMPDWNSASATPWYTHRNITVSVTLDGRFENLGNYAFHSNTQIGMVSIPATITRIGSNVFGGCTSLNQIIFEGDAPAFASNAFAGAAVTAYYPAGNSSWAKDVLQNYSGTVTWCSYSKLPSITSQPESVVAAVGKMLNFTVNATGDGLTYQWQYRSSMTGTWKATTLSGAKTATLKVSATTARNGYQYRCIITDANGSKITSNAVTLTVKPGPTIITQPKSVTANLNDSVSFTVEATGDGLTYQWQYRSSATGTWYSTTLSGNKTATIKTTATEARNGYQYRCVITDADGNKVTSNEATLTVKPGPVITSQPVSVTAKVGETVKFTVTATGEGLTYQWQWRKDDTSSWAATTVSGNKSSSITVPATAARNGYQYRCVVTDEGGNKITSNAATLTVKPGLVITSQPVSVTAKVGDTVKFTVAATGEGLTYQWQYRSSATGTWYSTTLSGNKTATIQATATEARNGYQYRCVITDADGNKVTSNAATLTVKTGPVITSQPVSVTAKVGDTVKFTVAATGEGLTYQWQWRKDASSAWAATTVSGNKTASITVSATEARNGYQYRCVITDADGNKVTSNAATLTVKAGLSITSQPVSITAAVGETAKFTVAAAGEGLTYQWQWRKDVSSAWAATTVSGNKTATISVPVTAARNSYQYRCKITDANGNVIYSNAVTLTVK